MKKNNLPVGLALIGGAVGLGLRHWQLTAGFEPDTGLAITGHPAALALIVWSVLVAAAAAALTMGCKESGDYDTAFCAEGDTLYMTLVVLAAFLLLGSAVLEAAGLSSAMSAARIDESKGVWLAMVMPPLRIVTAVAGAGCAVLVGRNSYKSLGEGRENLSLLGLCFLFCVWLVALYQKRAADPVTQNYLYEVLAVIAALMGFYYMAGWSFQLPKPRKSIFSFLMAVYFCLVTLADPHPLADRLRFAFALIFFTAHALILLKEHPAGTVPAETEETDNG